MPRNGPPDAREQVSRDDRNAPPVRGELKRPYRAPTLTEYGSVAKLTQGTLTLQNDVLMGGMRMSCL
jgi:hypothetical protein